MTAYAIAPATTHLSIYSYFFTFMQYAVLHCVTLTYEPHNKEHSH